MNKRGFMSWQRKKHITEGGKSISFGKEIYTRGAHLIRKALLYPKSLKADEPSQLIFANGRLVGFRSGKLWPAQKNSPGMVL